MVSEKPWKADGLILLVAGLLLSMSMGALLAQSLPRILPATEHVDLAFLRFIVGTLSIQGAALLLIHQFLRQHDARWRDLLVSREQSLARAFGFGFAAGLVVLPVAIVLNMASSEIMKLVQLKPELQTAITVIEKTAGSDKRIWFALAAIVLAPFVEEILFRGIMYPYLKQRINGRIAMVITSVAFAAIHFNVMIFIPLVFLGMVLVWLYERTDSLVTPIAAHAVFNAANFLMLIYQDDLARLLGPFLRERI